VPAVQIGPLLPFALFDQLLNLRFDRVEIERGRALHRAIVDGGLCQIGDCLLYEHEIREHTSRSCSRPNHSGFRHGSRGPFERILAQVNDRGHVSRHLFPRPTIRLLIELELLIDPDRAQFRPAKIE
jgi:hypothetical protein